MEPKWMKAIRKEAAESGIKVNHGRVGQANEYVQFDVTDKLCYGAQIKDWPIDDWFVFEPSGFHLYISQPASMQLAVTIALRCAKTLAQKG